MKNLSDLTERQIIALLVGGLLFILLTVGIGGSIFSNKKKESDATLADVMSEIESI